MSCDAITENDTLCKREAFCWQHLRLRARREVKKRADGTWKKFRPFASNVASGLVAAILFAAVQSGIRYGGVAWSGSQPKTTVTIVEPTKQTPLPQESRRNFEPSSLPVAVGSTCSVSPPAISSVSLQETTPTTDQLSISVSRFAVLGEATSSWPSNQSLSDAMAAAAAKNVSGIGNPLLTENQPFSPISFDASKMISSSSMEQTKALLDASVVASSQSGIAQMANLQMPANTGVLSDIATPIGYLPSSPTISGNGIPVVLPSTWQTPSAITGTASPTAFPFTVSTSPQ